MDKFSVASNSAEDTARVATALAKRLRPGDVVLLNGDLAAGKTTFVKAVAGALGSPDVVTSPTFTLAQFYKTRNFPLIHIDTYRLEEATEYEDLGLAEYQEDAASLIEWGDKVASEHPDCLVVLLERIALDDESATDAMSDVRTITFSTSTPRWQLIMDELEADILRGQP